MTSTEKIIIGIIGSGRMGTDIFYYLSEFDFPLVWLCIGEDEKTRLVYAYNKKAVRRFRNGLIDEKRLNQEKKHVVISCSPEDLSSCGIIIEAIQENAADKARLFLELEPHLRPDAVIVTNTSSIKPSLLIHDEKMKQRFAGLHFFFPVKLKNIVELILTEDTDAKTIEVLRRFLAAIGKIHLEMHEDDGFVLNRVFLDFQAQAFRLFHVEGLAMSFVDDIVKKDMFPAGVFEFFDAVGIDVMLQSIINYTEDMAGRDFYKPLIDYLEKLVSQNRLGRKTGKGFYDYPDESSFDELPGADVRGKILTRLQCLYVNSAFKALEKNIWSRDELEFALKEYIGIDTGPFAIADKMGTAAIKELLLNYYDKTGFDAYRPSTLL